MVRLPKCPKWLLMLIYWCKLWVLVLCAETKNGCLDTHVWCRLGITFPVGVTPIWSNFGADFLYNNWGTRRLTVCITYVYPNGHFWFLHREPILNVYIYKSTLIIPLDILCIIVSIPESLQHLLICLVPNLECTFFIKWDFSAETCHGGSRIRLPNLTTLAHFTSKFCGVENSNNSHQLPMQCFYRL